MVPAIEFISRIARNIKNAADGCDWRDETGTPSLGFAGLRKQAHTENIEEVDAEFSSCPLCFLLIYSKLLLC